VRTCTHTHTNKQTYKQTNTFNITSLLVFTKNFNLFLKQKCINIYKIASIPFHIRYKLWSFPRWSFPFSQPILYISNNITLHSPTKRNLTASQCTNDIIFTNCTSAHCNYVTLRLHIRIFTLYMDHCHRCNIHNV